jgi:guanylate cyclase
VFVCLQNCADTRVSDKRAFPTFARTLPPSNKISIFVVALLKDFNWNKFVLVVGRSPVWVQLKDAVTVRKIIVITLKK